MVGMPHPMFYGFLLHPVLGIGSVFVGPLAAVRIGVFMLHLCEFGLVTAALYRYTRHLWFCIGTTLLLLWAIYPQTNLYHRGAVCEFFATGFLTCALANFYLLLAAKTARHATLYSILIVFFMVLCSGAHAITCLYGCLFFLLITTSQWRRVLEVAKQFPKQLMISGGVGFIWALIVLSPWLQVVSKFKSDLYVSAYSGGGVADYPFDNNFLQRLHGLPLDQRFATEPPGSFGTPYLDTQINLALLLFFVGILLFTFVRDREKGIRFVRSLAFLVPLVTGVAFFYLSVYVHAFRSLPRAFSMVQFVYRLVTYIDLSIFAALLSLWILEGVPLKKTRDRYWASAMLAISLAFAFTAVVQKMQRSWMVRTPFADAGYVVDRAGRGNLLNNGGPPDFTGNEDYSTIGLFPEVEKENAEPFQRVRFPVSTGKPFGLTEPVRISLNKPTLLVTNVKLFPWNKIAIDGEIVSREDLVRAHGVESAVVHAGTHELSYVFSPPPAWMRKWMWSHRLFFAATLGLFLYLFWLLRKEWQARRFP